jgi:hypothetical protein
MLPFELIVLTFSRAFQIDYFVLYAVVILRFCTTPSQPASPRAPRCGSVSSLLVVAPALICRH